MIQAQNLSMVLKWGQQKEGGKNHPKGTISFIHISACFPQSFTRDVFDSASFHIFHFPSIVGLIVLIFEGIHSYPNFSPRNSISFLNQSYVT